MQEECSRHREYEALENGIKGRIAYQLRCMELERDKRVLKGTGCSVTLYQDSSLEPSLMYRNCWVKPLPSQAIIKRLKSAKNHLHTAGLICPESEQNPISEKLLRAGVIRVTKSRDMSLTWSGEAHDGQFPLMRYSRIVTF